MRPGCALLCSGLVLGFVQGAAAQSYPTKPIRLVSPFPASGGTDVAGRIIAQALSEQLGQQVIVENRGGAGGRIGMEYVAHAPPDGYTLVMGNVGPFAITPASGIELRYEPVRDFQPVSLIATSDYVLTCHPSLPARSVKELLALAKAKPGAMTYGSSGNVSGPHLSGALLSMLGKVDILHIPYKGNGPAAVALMSGEITILFGRGAIMPYLDNGKLRGIATTGAQRSMPALPTIAETLPGYEITQWYGIMAPAAIPREILARLYKEIVAAVAVPKVAQAYTTLGMEPRGSTPEEFAAFIKAETARYTRLIRTARIKVE